MASASLLSFHPHPLLISRSPIRTRARSPSLHRAPIGPFPPHRGASTVARLSPLGELPDLDALEGLARDLFGRAEGVIYTVADAAVTASNADGVTAEGAKRSSDWLSGITNYMEVVLKVLKDGLSSLHVPYAYGFAIILLTVLVKAATFPLTKKQVESAMSMRSLQPQVKAIQERYAGDPEKIQMETARLYKLAGVNPLAGCLPTLATIPVWIGLYRALSNVADEGLLTEGFFWIPTLAGPTTSAARQSGSGTSWLFPFVDGHPPLGWPDTIAYLVLPVLLVISQYISAQFMQPSQGNDQSQNSSQALTKLLPLMIGYFALSVPSGLSLYWFTNNILSTAQQIWLQKLGGAKTSVNQYIDKTPLDEPSSIQNSVSSIQKSDLNIGSAKVERKQDEKVDSGGLRPGGLRPGERFKQIKEQEARRKKQREEEKRKTVSNLRINVDQEVTDPILIENIDGQVPKENQIELCMPETTNGAPNFNNGSTVKDRETQEDLEKDKVAESHASSGKQTEALDKRDPETGRD